MFEALAGRGAVRAGEFSLSSSESDEDLLKRAVLRRRNLDGRECSLRRLEVKSRRLPGDGNGDGDVSGEDWGLAVPGDSSSSTRTS
jgi:hypothetical protein